MFWSSRLIRTVKRNTYQLLCIFYCYQVMWVYGKLYLAVARRVVINDKRFSVPKKGSKNVWNLQIRNVKYRDAGIYRCNVDTESPMVRSVFLNVERKLLKLYILWTPLFWQLCVLITSQILCHIQPYGGGLFKLIKHILVWLSKSRLIFVKKNNM